MQQSAIFSKQISTYNYSGNTIYGQTVISYPGTPDPDYLLRDTAVVDAAGNLISDKKYFFNGTAYEADITYQYAYDTHHDPFARLTLVKSLKQFSWDAQERMLENGGKYPNNVIAETSFQPGQTPVTAPTIYTYNAAGYPLTETDGTSTDKTIYTYRHL